MISKWVRRSTPSVTVLLTAALVFALFAWVLFFPISDLVARHDVGAITGPHRADALRIARDAARGRLLQLAGVFAAAAFVYNARTFTLQRQLTVVTEQNKAIEQLDSQHLDVRIGGIYTLERVARDSHRDHPTIMEVLAAFIRERSREQPQREERQDVLAAVTVVGRRNERFDYEAIDLTRADLTGVDLIRMHLVGARLIGANLTRADLTGADLTGADLTGANLTSANLTGTMLNRAILTGADLADAFRPPEDAVPGGLLRDEVPEGWQRDADSGRLQRAVGDSGDAAAE